MWEQHVGCNICLPHTLAYALKHGRFATDQWRLVWDLVAT